MSDEMLRFRNAATGAQEEIAAGVDDAELPAGELLRARRVWLEDGSPNRHELRQHRRRESAPRQGAYTRLDNEILAGRAMQKIAGWHGYPAQVSCLYGDEATSAEPYTLFEPYRGEPVSAGESLFDDEVDAFITGLLTGLCWLAAAGIAHRGISPETVYWTDSTVLITDFSRSAPFGAARTPVTGLSLAWVPLESRASSAFGNIGPTDDVWGAVRLIYFVASRGEDLVNEGQLAEIGLTQKFNGLLQPVFGHPSGRPTAAQLLQHGLRQSHVLPNLPEPGTELSEGRRAFLRAREQKHANLPVPDAFWADLAWSPGAREGGA